MRWRTRDLWKIGITVAGMLLFLVLMTWVPVSAAIVHEKASGLATLGTITVQATPTEDPTMTANKTAQAQLTKLQLDNDRSFNAWFWTNGVALISSLALVLGGVITILRYFSDRHAERKKRAEERFQAAVEGLSSERKEAKIGAAILLRTFLRPGYKQFYRQVFDLAVAHLCPTETPHSPEDEAPLILTILRQALIVVFKEAFPLVRSQKKGNPQSLDASYIQLDNAYLRGADLKQAWMPEATLRGARLSGADLSNAELLGASLSGADLSNADLHGAKFLGASLRGAKLLRASLSEADLSEANLSRANLQGANLSRANLSSADLSEANLSETNFENALSLDRTKLHGIKGLTKDQLAACKAKGAIIDEDTTISVSLSAVAPSSSSQCNDEQTSSSPSPQENVPPSHVDENSGVVPAQDSPDEHS